MSYIGIDYGCGTTNIDLETGIRYGVIGQNSLDIQAFHDSTTPTFPGPNCPRCGGDVVPSEEVKNADLWKRRTKHGCFDYACLSCREGFDSSECYGEADGWQCDDSEYDILPCLGTDVMVTRSPYYTLAAFCSPCVPGAGDLDSPHKDGARAYCLGHEWFDGGVAPYPVYRVSDDTLVSADNDLETAAA